MSPEDVIITSIEYLLSPDAINGDVFMGDEFPELRNGIQALLSLSQETAPSPQLLYRATTNIDALAHWNFVPHPSATEDDRHNAETLTTLARQFTALLQQRIPSKADGTAA